MFKLVLNASPIIVMGKLGYLDLLPSIADEIVIPRGVYNEVLAGNSCDPARKWLLGSGGDFVKEVGVHESKVVKWDLGLGETEVLSFAYRNRDFYAVVDDKMARRCAKALGIKVKGTLALLVIACKTGFIEDIEVILRRLRQEGFYMSKSLEEAIRRIV